MAERTPERLVRLLGLVAYLDGRTGVPVDEVAKHFGVTPAQVLRDIDTLWVTGTPGYFPDDLIDFDADSLESGVVRITQVRGMARPLRLGTREAVALLAALRALAEAVGPSLDSADAGVLQSTIDLITAATGSAAATVDVQLTVDGSPQVLTAARTALRDGRRLHLRYVDAADRTTERDVDPWQLVTGDERSYLAGWCHTVGGERLFRLDRILSAEVTTAPVVTRQTRADTGFRPSADYPLVTIILDRRARWAAEQLPVESVIELDDGGFEVAIRVTSAAWLRRLLLRLAPWVRGVEPADAALDAAAAARRALAAYGGDDLATIDAGSDAKPVGTPGSSVDG